MYFKLLLTLTSLGLLVSFTEPGPKPSLKTAMKILNGFCSYVPSGYAMLNGDSSSVQAFYMSSTEITNLQYNEFLADLKKMGETDKLAVAQIDTACWTRGKMYGEPMAKYYHSHPAYYNYPVVGISKEGAELFCAWLSEKYLALSNGELKLQFRLPTQEEWIRAARGNKHYQTYAWETPYLRNKEGNVQANFLNIGAENVRRNGETGEFEIALEALAISPEDGNVDLLAPAKSYWPSEQGFYNLNGNVAEWLADGQRAAGGAWTSPGFDIRNESIMQVQGTRPDVGFRVVATIVR